MRSTTQNGSAADRISSAVFFEESRMKFANATNPQRKSTGRRVLRIVLVAALIGIAGWFLWVYGQIHFYATHDEARPADAIAVFGAAEYDGRPSPVLRARLEHALALYRERLAPLVITLGGGGDPHDSEGGVGHDYLLAHGVPETQIIAETQSTNTRGIGSPSCCHSARESPQPDPCRLRRDPPVSHPCALRQYGAECGHLAPRRGTVTGVLGLRHAVDA